MFDLDDLVERSRLAADVDWSAVSDGELLAAVLEWQAIVSAVEAGAGQALGELQKRGVTEARYGLKTAAWVAAESKVDRRAVARRMRTAMHLRCLPQVTAGVVDGTLSADHATEMASAASNPRIGDQVVAGQTFWIDLARATSFADWQHQLRHTVAELDQDGGYDPNRDLARNTLRLTPFPDGVLSLGGELVGERALTVRHCVEAHADHLFQQLQRDHDLCPELPLPKRSTLLAMALAELVLRGAAVDRESTPGPSVDITLVIETKDRGRIATETTPPPIGPICTTDATSASDATGLADATIPWTTTTRHEGCGDHADLHLHDPHDDDPHAHDGGCGCPQAAMADLLRTRPVLAADGHRVAPEVAAALVCDPLITALIVDTLGVPLDLGRQTRLANRDQRRALAHRDGGCVFPGCDAPTGWCDAHHVTWWHHNGPTDIDNLALLCRYHHGITHRHGWTMTAHPDHTFTWRTPTGQTLHSQRHRGRRPTAQLQPA